MPILWDDEQGGVAAPPATPTAPAAGGRIVWDDEQPQQSTGPDFIDPTFGGRYVATKPSADEAAVLTELGRVDPYRVSMLPLPDISAVAPPERPKYAGVPYAQLPIDEQQKVEQQGIDATLDSGGSPETWAGLARVSDNKFEKMRNSPENQQAIRDRASWQRMAALTDEERAKLPPWVVVDLNVPAGYRERTPDEQIAVEREANNKRLAAGEITPAEHGQRDVALFQREVDLIGLKDTLGRKPSNYDVSVQREANSRGAIAGSLPVRTIETVGKGLANKATSLLGGVESAALNAVGATGLADLAADVRNQAQSANSRQQDVQAALDTQGVLGDTLTSWLRQGGATVGESLAVGAAGGVPATALWYGATTVDEQLAQGARPDTAMAHGLIEGAFTMLGGKLGAGASRLAGAAGGETAEGAAGAVAKWAAQKFPVSKPIADVMAATGAEVGEEFLTEASHYMVDVAAGRDEWSWPRFWDRTKGVIGPSLVAGAAGEVGAKAFESKARKAEKSARELFEQFNARKKAIETQSQNVVGPGAVVRFSPAVVPGKNVSQELAINPQIAQGSQELAIASPVDLESIVPPEVQPTLTDAPVAPIPTPEPTNGNQEQAGQVAQEVQQNLEGQVRQDEQGQELLVEQPPIPSEPQPVLERPAVSTRKRKVKFRTYSEFSKWHDAKQAEIDSRVDAHLAAGVPFSEAYQKPDVKQLQDEASAALSAAMRSVGRSVEMDVSDLWDKWRPNGSFYNTRKPLGSHRDIDGDSALQWFLREHFYLPYQEKANAVSGEVDRAAVEGDAVQGSGEPSRAPQEETRAASQEEAFQLDRPAPAPPAATFESAPTSQPDLIPDLWRGSLPGQSGLFEDDAQGAAATPGAPLTPATTPAVTQPIKGQREIITDISKALGVPIGFGRMRWRDWGGAFQKIANLINSKRANDIPVVTHEAGHKLDQMFKFSDDPQLRAELDVLGAPASVLPGSRSSWKRGRSRKYRLEEGVAEFVRRWMIEPDEVTNRQSRTYSPGMLAAWNQALDTNKGLGDSMRQTQEDIRLWRTAEPQARLRSHISIGDNPNGTRYTLAQLTRDSIDDLHMMRLAVDDAKRRTPGLSPKNNPYLLARNLRGSFGMAEAFINRGVVQFDTKSVALGTSLEDALKPVAGRINDFRDYIIARRADELHKQGRETGLVDSDVQFTLQKFASDTDFQDAFNQLKAWNDGVLQYAVDGGLITQDSAKAMRQMNQDYVPFHRLFEVGAGEPPSQEASGSGRGLNVGTPGSLKRLKGSTRSIVDPLETMIKNAYTIITAAEKANISRAVAELGSLPDMGRWVYKIGTPKEANRLNLADIRKQLENNGADVSQLPDDLALVFFRTAQRAPYGENTIRVVRNGNAEFFRLNRHLYDTFHALDLEDNGLLLKILSQPAQLLRAGVVLEPGFNLANALRDTFSAAVLSKYGALPFETTLRGLAAMVSRPQLVAEWMAAGGKSSIESNFFDRKQVQRFITDKITKDRSIAEQAWAIAKTPFHALRMLSGTIEEATRLGEYEIAMRELLRAGMTEGEARRLAAFEARDRQDFAKGGSKTKILRGLTAFWNANLQANVKLVETFRKHPVRTTLQGLAFITIPKLIEQAMNWDDEDYWNRPQWERDLFFLIPMGKDESGHTSFLKVPTPFEIGVIFGTIPGRLLQAYRQNDPEAAKSLPGTILKQATPNPTPQSLLVLIENMIGKQGYDFFRGRPIVPDALADAPPEYQFTSQTSEAAKTAGRTFGVSPLKIDHFIEQTLGGVGKTLTGKQTPWKRFVTTPLAVSNQTIEDFYAIQAKLRQDEYSAKQEGRVPPRHLPLFERGARAMSEIRRQANATTDPQQKADLQERIYQLAKELVEEYRKEN